MISFRPILAIPWLLSVAEALVPNFGAVTTITTTQCTTALVESSVATVSTSWTTIVTALEAVTSISMYHPGVSQTPSPVTTTTTAVVTVTSMISQAIVTDTFSTTITSYSTTTLNATTSYISTIPYITSSTTTATTTVPAPSGFHPVSDTVDGYPALQRRYNAYLKRELNNTDGQAITSQYPKEVYCTQLVKIESTRQMTVTRFAITSTMKPVTVTSTVTLTVSTSSMLTPPHASATTTIFTSSLIQETSTTTKTINSTSTVLDLTTATATAYAACGKSNILGPKFSEGSTIGTIDSVLALSGVGWLGTTAASPYDCCVACLLGTDCVTSLYEPAYGICFMANREDNTCPNQSSAQTGFVIGNDAAQFSFVLSNGPCGYTSLVTSSNTGSIG